MFQIQLNNLPDPASIVANIEFPVKAPRVDNLFTVDGEPIEPSDLAPDQIAQKLGQQFFKFFMRNGHVRLGRNERQAVMKKLNPILNSMGWELAPIGKE